MRTLDSFQIRQIPREDNRRANALAQQASGYEVRRGSFVVKEKPMITLVDAVRDEWIEAMDGVRSAAGTRLAGLSSMGDMLAVGRSRMTKLIEQPSTRSMSVTGVSKPSTMDELLLKCLNKDQARIAMGEVDEGMCGAHQSAQKMKWAIQRAGLYWPSMVDDCIKYKKGSEACQQFGDVQTVLASMLYRIVKVWPFRGWGLDFVGEVHPASSKGHIFVLVATDYFTKWTEVMPLRNMTHREVISFVQEHIIHRFGIPQTLTIDQGASFMSH
jgi:hypothetical protein